MFLEFLDRLEHWTDIKNQSDLARVLNISSAAVSGAKKKDQIPDNWLVKLAGRYKIAPEWFLTGEGQPPIRATEMSEGFDSSKVFLTELPPLAALVAEHELRLRDLDMRESQIIEHLRGILGARGEQARKHEKEQGYQIREAKPDYGQVHEKSADWPSKSSNDPKDDPENDTPLPNHSD